jgi:phenylalanyl-tRNA synthetase alpha chain
MLHEEIQRLRAEIDRADLRTREQLDQFRQSFLSRKGRIAALFDQLRDVPADARRAVGAALNELKNSSQQRHDERQAALEAEPQRPAGPAVDYTLPPVPDGLGSRHPLTVVQEQIVDIFARIGFAVATGPEIEDDWHNFTGLNFPPDHPAREMQDTFFVQPAPGAAADGQEPLLLRTHTSTVQVRLLDEVKAGRRSLPIRAVMPGRVYRNEAISARAHQLFHQIEGLYVDKDVSFADLKQVIYYFLTEFFGPDVRMRMRPSYFPFTEPSAEVDVSCQICKGPGCNVCKYTGWVEVLGCGMVDPAVLEASGIDPAQYSGFAFGMGIERTAMGKFTVKDLRLFTENDVRFLRQFESL